MADLTAEQFGQLPDFVKSDYEQAGEVYRPVAEGKLSALKGSMNDLDQRYKQSQTRIDEIERTKADEIKAARDEALKTAVSKGDTEAIKKRYDEEIAHLRAHSDETVAEHTKRIEKLAGVIKSDKRNLALSAIAGELKVFDDSKKLFNKLVADRIDIDPETGKETYLDENGGATSLDRAGFIAEIAKDSGFDRFRNAEVNKGGDANGSGDRGGASKVNEKAADAKKKGDLNGFLAASLNNQ